VGWPLSGRDLLAIFAFWTALAILSVANRLLDPRGPGLQFGIPAAPIALILAESWIWAVLTPLIFWLSSRFSPERTHWALLVVLYIAAGVVIAACADAVLDFLRSQVFHPPRRRGASMVFVPFRGAARLWFLNEFLIYVAILVTGFAREYYRQFRRRQREAVVLRAETAQLQAQLAEARLEALRMQINPHFLFNTLHAISALVERDPAGVRRMIARLSELLRYVLEKTDAPEVPLVQEFDFLQRYLEVMEIRFQGRLQVQTRIQPEVRDALVPHLILQSLVENAIKHGVSRMEGLGTIELSAERRGDWLRLVVRDNGPGMRGAELEEGVGLKNTRARLDQFYGSDQSLTLHDLESGGVEAVIEIPFHTRADLRTSGVVDE
jgi:two-component system LytT family sensor kinase